STTTDKDGNVTNIYRQVTPPVKTPLTNFVDENGTPIKDPEEGSKPNEPVSGYELVSSTTDKDGNVTNVYRQVTPPVKTLITNFVDENGTPIKDPEEGSKPNEPVSGYEIVSTSTDKDGNVTNVYRQVTPPVKTPLTNFVDENGTPIKDPEEGSKPNEPISGYEIVSTSTDKDGNVTNVYRQVTPPVKTPITNFVDENGTPIKDPEEGSKPNEPVSGYELVSSTTDKDGNVTNVYRQVTPPVKTPITNFVDENGTPIKDPEEGSKPNEPISGYEIVSTTTDKDGNVTNVYRQVTLSEQVIEAEVPQYVTKETATLPNTGDNDSAFGIVAGIVTATLGLFGLRRRKED
ncbi:LPXTG cell wall anchor domain-containing protein, partial [Streptococcus ovuberis]